MVSVVIVEIVVGTPPGRRGRMGSRSVTFPILGGHGGSVERHGLSANRSSAASSFPRGDDGFGSLGGGCGVGNEYDRHPPEEEVDDDDAWQS